MKIFTKLLTLIALSLLTTEAMAQIFVDASKTSGGNNGTSWTDAYTDLQLALDDPNLITIGQIWVAKGIYKPSKTFGGAVESPVSRDATFVLPQGVRIYGGFAGTEGFLSQRDALKVHTDNKTTLSGDFNEDDGVSTDAKGIVTGITNNGENAYHVVVSYNNTATTVLDGFTISGGNADGAGSITPESGYAVPKNQGGGIFLRKSSPVLNNLIVKNNNATAAQAGSGMYIHGGKQNLNPISTDLISITQTTFLNNHAPNAVHANTYNHGAGAGVFIAAESATYIANVAISDCTFSGNFSKGIGALRPGGNVNLTVSGSTFYRNRATYGGAVYLQSNQTTPIKIKNCSFIENEGTSQGGAINSNTNGNLEVYNSKFIRNESTSGGGIFTTGSFQTLAVSTLFYKNVSTGTGGGITISGASGRVVNCVFFENESATNGGALRLATSGTLTVQNTIILGNTSTAGAIDISRSGTAVINVSNSFAQAAAETGITYNAGVRTDVVANDIFVNTTNANHDDFLKLIEINTNPAIDAGLDADYDEVTLGDKDIRGYNRKYNFKGNSVNQIDLGVYEIIPLAVVLPVKLSAALSAKSNGSSIIVTWVTETETNNSHFVLEKSTDGVTFVTIATPVSKGNGANYSHTDYSPLAGTSYYRLSQVDKDGTKVTFDPVVVNFSLQDKASVNVYPNPAVGGKITINLAGNKFTKLQLVNLQGQSLQSLKIAANETEKTVDISNYPSGTYFIVLSNGAEKTIKKILKP